MQRISVKTPLCWQTSRYDIRKFVTRATIGWFLLKAVTSLDDHFRWKHPESMSTNNSQRNQSFALCLSAWNAEKTILSWADRIARCRCIDWRQKLAIVRCKSNANLLNAAGAGSRMRDSVLTVSSASRGWLTQVYLGWKGIDLVTAVECSTHETELCQVFLAPMVHSCGKLFAFWSKWVLRMVTYARLPTPRGRQVLTRKLGQVWLQVWQECICWSLEPCLARGSSVIVNRLLCGPSCSLPACSLCGKPK